MFNFNSNMNRYGLILISFVVLFSSIESTKKRNEIIHGERPTVNERALCNAVYIGNITEVERLLLKGTDPNCRTDGYFPIQLALFSRKRSEIFKMLLGFGANVNVQDKITSWWTIHTIVRFGNLEMLSVLLNAGANVDVVDIRGKTALTVAMGIDNRLIPYTWKIVGMLLEAKLKTGKKFFTLIELKTAAKRGYFNVVRAIVNSGVDTSFAGIKFLLNDKPLIYASEMGSLEIVKDLVASREEDVNDSNFNGETALIKAVQGGHVKVIEYLLKHGARLHAVDNKGFSALEYAKMRHHVGNVKILRHYGAENYK